MTAMREKDDLKKVADLNAKVDLLIGKQMAMQAELDRKELEDDKKILDRAFQHLIDPSTIRPAASSSPSITADADGGYHPSITADADGGYHPSERIDAGLLESAAEHLSPVAPGGHATARETAFSAARAAMAARAAGKTEGGSKIHKNSRKYKKSKKRKSGKKSRKHKKTKNKKTQ